MKALKEKRISLRSLWRRGLVILSLFALVFASCSDSDKEAPAPTVDKSISKVISYEGEETTLYLGVPIDLSKFKATVNLTGSKDPVTLTNGFVAVPEVATGEYAIMTGTFIPMSSYKIMHGLTTIAEVPVTVIDIIREQTTRPDDDPLLTFRGAYKDMGIYTASAGPYGSLANKKVYADDLSFDFTGLGIGAYHLGEYEPKEINLSKTDWMILPDYLKKPGKLAADDYYDGYVYIMVGADTENVMLRQAGLDPDDPLDAAAILLHDTQFYRYGVTYRIPLEAVYTVTELTSNLPEAAPVTTTPGPRDYYFWQPNTPESWLDRLEKADFELTVKYTGPAKAGRNPMKFTVPELRDRKIWYNENPAGEHEDFFVMPLTYPFNKKSTDVNNGYILVYYRGATGDGAWGEKATKPLRLQMNVFTTFKKLYVTANGSDISFDTDEEDPGRDNDIGTNGRGSSELEFAAKFKVEAEYSTYNTGVTQRITIPNLIPTFDPNPNPGFATSPFDHATVNPRDIHPFGSANGVNYVTNWDSVRLQQLEKQLNAGTKAKPLSANVSVTYQVDLADVVYDLINLPVLDPTDQQGTYYFRPKENPVPTTIFGTNITVGDLVDVKPQSISKTTKFKVTWNYD